MVHNLTRVPNTRRKAYIIHFWILLIKFLFESCNSCNFMYNPSHFEINSNRECLNKHRDSLVKIFCKSTKTDLVHTKTLLYTVYSLHTVGLDMHLDQSNIFMLHWWSFGQIFSCNVFGPWILTTVLLFDLF